MQQSTGFLTELKKQKWYQIMAIPGVIWMIIFSYIPMLFLIIAFRQYILGRNILGQGWIWFQNFSDFFSDSEFWPVMRNTLGISFWKLLIGFPLPIIFAIMLNELRSNRFKRIAQTISYLPHFLSWVILGGIVMFWLSDIGVVNSILIKMGLIQDPIIYIADPKYFWTISVTTEIWKELGWNSIIYLAAIAGIDVEMYEAATVDGAGRWRKIWNITLPSIKGTVLILFVLNVGGIMGSNFDQIMVFQNVLNSDASNVIDLYVYQTGIHAGRYSYAAAIGLFRSGVSVMLLLLANYATRKLSDTSLI